MTLEQLIEAAEVDFGNRRGVCGGSEFKQFSLYIVPVQARTKPMQKHYRTTYYLNRKRVTKDAFMQAWLSNT